MNLVRTEDRLKLNKKWYLPNAENFDAKGPFSTEEIERRLKIKELAIDDFIWSDDKIEEKWCRIFECAEFHSYLPQYPKCKLPKKHSKGLASQVIKVMFKNEGRGEYGYENSYRRYPRAPISSQSIVHNQKIYIEAYCVDISEKGVLVEVSDLSVFKEGDEVVLTLLEHNVLGTFCVNAVVIHKTNNNGKNLYGLFFLKIAPQIKRKIAEYVISKLEHARKMEEKTA